MATTSHESEFDWIKRQGKEFQDLRALPSRAKDSLLAIAGGTAIVVGSLLPWVAFNDADVEIRPGAKTASVVLGLVVAALGFALRRAPAPGRLAAGIAMVCLSALAGLLYVAFIVSGIHGVPGQDQFGDVANFTFYPNVGIMAVVAGCGAAFIAAIMSFHHGQD